MRMCSNSRLVYAMLDTVLQYLHFTGNQCGQCGRLGSEHRPSLGTDSDFTCTTYINKLKIITVNRLVHYGESQHYFGQYWPYGQDISGPELLSLMTIIYSECIKITMFMHFIISFSGSRPIIYLPNFLSPCLASSGARVPRLIEPPKRPVSTPLVTGFLLWRELVTEC